MITKDWKSGLPEQMHKWYLEAVKELHPESFNPNANKPYSELTDEQRFLDKYIADKCLLHFTEKVLGELEKEREIKLVEIKRQGFEIHPEKLVFFTEKEVREVITRLNKE